MNNVGLVKGYLKPKISSFEWKIENFLANCKKAGDYYMSPAFSIAYDKEITKWYLRVYPKGYNQQYNEHVSLYLYLVSDTKTEVTVDFRLSILSEQNIIPSKEKKGHTFKTPSSNWGWFSFIEHNVIEDTRNGVLIDDTLIILCEITFCHTGQDVKKSSHGLGKWLDRIGNGLSDYEQLLESDNFADVTFNVQNKKIHSHKAILSCRSPVFKAMFEHEMKEKKQNSVDITDVDYDVMKELFRFIYSGKVKNIEKIASDLLIAADKYQVIELKALCEKTLYDKLTVNNAIEYLKLTAMYDTMQLKRLVIKFVAAHHNDVVKKPGFADLSSNVMHQIMLAVAEKEEK